MEKTTPILRTVDLAVYFSLRRAAFGQRGGKEVVHAVDGVSLSVDRGESLAVVGETGSGKSTLARAIVGLVRPTSGRVEFLGSDLSRLSASALKAVRRDMALVAQDPFDALNPRQRVGEILALPLRVHQASGKHSELIRNVLHDVGLSPDDYIGRYPHEMSGGQRQRVAIARALTLRPKLLVADEPVTALDMSIRAQVLNLLRDLKAKYSLTYIVVAHDLAMVRYLCTSVMVLYLGTVVERADVSTVFKQPLHPYTKALMSAIPSLERRSMDGDRPLGDPPSPIDIPPGCRFHTRCPFVIEVCRTTVPELRSFSNGSSAACHRAEELASGGVTESRSSAAPNPGAVQQDRPEQSR